MGKRKPSKFFMFHPFVCNVDGTLHTWDVNTRELVKAKSLSAAVLKYLVCGTHIFILLCCMSSDFEGAIGEYIHINI